MNNGKGLQLLLAEIMNSIKAASEFEDLLPYAKKLKSTLSLAQEVVQFLMDFAKKGDYERFLSDATVFMEFFGNIIVGWLWLDIAVKAQNAMVLTNANYSSVFYESKIHAMKFYFKYEIPKTKALAEVLMDEQVLTTSVEKQLFT